MGKISYRWLAIILLFIAVVMLVILKNTDFEEYIKYVGIAISINLISSVIIIYLIDFKREDDMNQELENKRKIIYGQLIQPLRNFDDLILNMYKSCVSFQEMEELEYNIDNVDKILEKIKLLDTSKEGYMRKMDFKTIPLWKETIALNFSNLLKDIDKFYADNAYYLSLGLTEDINQILKIKSNKMILNLMLNPIISMEMGSIIDVFDFKQLLFSSFNIKEEISKYYSEEQFKINKEKFLREDISPGFGSGIKKS